MVKKVICPKINKEVFLAYDIIDISTFDNPNQYIIGTFSHCSACNNICKDCQLIDNLYGQPINSK